MKPDSSGTGESGIGHWEVFAQTGELFWSDEVYRIHGLEPGGTIDIEAAIEAYHPDDRAKVAELLNRALEEKKDYQFDLRLVRADGDVRHVRSTGVVRLEPSGDVRSVFGVFQDLTEQKHTEAALAASEERFRDMAANVPGIVYQFRMDGAGTPSFPYVSPAIERLFGIKAEAVTAYPDTLLETIHPDDRLNWEASIASSRLDSDPWIWEGRMRRDSGTYGWFQGSATPRPLADGSTLWNGLLFDITDRKQADAALQESERNLREAQRIAGLGYWSWTLETDKTIWSEESYRILGVDPAETEPSGQLFRSLIDPEDRDRVSRRAKAALESDAPYSVEYRARRSDGDVRHIFEQAQVKRDPHGRPIGMHGTLLDITERKRSERALRASEARFRGIIENSSSAIFLKDLEGRFQLVNSKFEEWHGVTAAEVIGKTYFDIYSKERAEFCSSLDRDLLDGTAAQERELEMPFQDGRLHKVILTKFPVRGVDDKIVGIGTIVTDVTAQREAEERLHQAQKMEAVGQLTGGVAHDFNNLLAVIRGNAELLADEAEADPSLTQPLLRAADRGVELTHRLLAFSRRQPLKPKAIDVQALVSGMSSLLSHALGAPIEIVIKSSPGLRHALADPGQVENALLNLAINARDAMPGGGRLTIECANASLDSPYVAENPGAFAGDYVVLAVSDTGTGMSPEVKAHAFEPFYTTKEVGQGSGLGLSMVYGFAKQSGGHVAIVSEKDRGATVRLYLPCAPGASRPENSEPKREMPKGQGEVILVIEDDADVRALAVRLLQHLKYRVIDVPTAAGAREILAAQRPVDLILSDIVLPGGTSGTEFAAEACASRPDLKVILMSGYPAQAVDQNADWVLLGKPFERHELAGALRQALD